MRRMLAWAGLAGLFAYLVVLGGGWYGIYRSDLRMFTVLMAALTMGVWTHIALRNPAWRPRSALLPAILVCLVSFALSTALSRYPRVSLEYLGYAVVLAALYLLLVRIMAEPFFRRRITTLLAILFVTISLYYLFLTLESWVFWWSMLGHLAIPPLRPDSVGLAYANPSAVLTVVILLALPAVAVASSAAHRTVLLAVIVVLTSSVALVSGSRAGWLGIALTGAVSLIVAVASPRLRAKGFGALRSTWKRAPVVLLAGVVALTVAAVAFAPAVLRRAAGGGEDLRLTYVLIALRLFAQSPLVGTGPGTWVIQRVAETHADEPDYYIPHAHNLLAQTSAELGLVGLLAGLVLAGWVAWLIRDAVRGESAERRRWGWLAAAGLVYLFFHQLLDFYANFPAVLFLAAVPIACLDATAGDRRPTRRMATAFSGRALAAACLVVAVALGALLLQELPAGLNAQAVAAAEMGDWAGADGPARQAAAMDPAILSYSFTAGLTASRAGDHQAAADYFHIVAIGTDLPEAWLNLAAEEERLGNSEAALRALNASLRLGYERPAVAVPAGELAYRLGATDLAARAFAAAIVNAPSLAGDPWWEADEKRLALRAQAAAAAATSSPGSAWEIALVSGDYQTAIQLVRSGTGPASAADIVAAWQGDGPALARLVDGCIRSPLDAGGLVWCARVENHSGNAGEADRFRQLAGTIIGDGAGSELRIGPQEQQSTVGNPAAFWGTFTYRRPTPWDILVPSLAHVTIE